jgi:hypothetical protein
VFIDVYTVGSICFWHHSTDIGCILLHLKFERGLSISILRNKATLYKKMESKTEEFF